GDHDLSKERSRLKNKFPCSLVENIRADQVAGQQVRRELNAAKRAIQTLGQRLGQQRFADAGNILNEKVSFRQESDEGHADRLRLAEQHFADIVQQALKQSAVRLLASLMID